VFNLAAKLVRLDRETLLNVMHVAAVEGNEQLQSLLSRNWVQIWRKLLAEKGQ